jgi:hypothetical protein
MATFKGHCRKCKANTGKTTSDKDWGKFVPDAGKCPKCGGELNWRSNDLLVDVFSISKRKK